MRDIIYLASPYTATEEIQQWRYDTIVKVCVELFKRKLNIFSPVVHCHPIYLQGKAQGIDPDFKFWQDYNHEMLFSSQRLMICMLPEWAKSQGIAQELEWARTWKMPVHYIDWKTFDVTPSI